MTHAAFSVSGSCLQVLNAFEMPRIEWDGAQKRFVRSNKRPSLHPEPLSKPEVLLGRLQMILQTVLRGEQFRGRSLKSSAGQAMQVCTHARPAARQ